MKPRQNTQTRSRGAAVIVAIAVELLVPLPACGQLDVEVTAGVLAVGEIASAANSVGPVISLTLGTGALGIPVLLEGAVSRIDFTSFGEPFHRNYGFMTLATEWLPVREPVAVGLRLGVGASVEDDISEDDPAFFSSNNWAEALVPALVLKRTLASGRQLVFTISDHILGPFNAVLDPEEYGVEHRVRVLFGVRF